MTTTSGRAPTTGDEGRVLLLALVYAAILVALILVVSAATAVHLERKRLLDLADLTALHAADAMAPADYFGRPADGDLIHLTDEAVRTRAQAHLDSAPEAARFAGLDLVEASSPDGRTAVIRLRAHVRLPVASEVVATEGVVTEVIARARAD